MALSSSSLYAESSDSRPDLVNMEKDTHRYQQQSSAVTMKSECSNKVVKTVSFMSSASSFVVSLVFMTIFCISVPLTEARSPFIAKQSLVSERISSSLLPQLSLTSLRRSAVAWTLSHDNRVGVLDSKFRYNNNDLFNLFPRGGAVEDDDEEDSENEGNEQDDEDEVEQDVDDEEEEEEEVVVVKKTRRKLSKSLKKLKVQEEQEDDDDNATADSQLGKSAFDEPYFASPMIQLYTTFAFMLFTRKLDLFQPRVVRVARFAFIAYIVLLQAFVFYVRIQAKLRNDRTPITTTNPLSGIIENQLGGGGKDAATSSPAMPLDMVKNLASSFLSSSSTVMEYDLNQARSMQGGVLFNMAFMWFLHFKMEQIQPLFIQSATGMLNLVYSPLFQVYVLGRNLERPFKQPPSKNPLRIPTEENNSEEEEAQPEATPAIETDSSSSNSDKVTKQETEEDDSDDEVSNLIEQIVGDDDDNGDASAESAVEDSNEDEE